MADDKMQLQRFELKYQVEERQALAIRDFVRCYLDVDEYGATLPNHSYPVHSLYLDSPDLHLYQETINGTKNRFKLRLRFYENRPDAPVYFEIKRRMNNIISKQRGGVRREAVEWLLAGQLPEPAHLVSKEPRHHIALQRFCELMNALQASPKTHIAYLREAWLSRRDNSVRVTLDRRVETEIETTCRLATQMTNPVLVFEGPGNRDRLKTSLGHADDETHLDDIVILELKFTNRFPDWFKELVRVFGLMQCGAAKYAEGVDKLGVEHVRRGFALPVSGNGRPLLKPVEKPLRGASMAADRVP